MKKEMEEIREKVHTTADAALFLCFQELNGSHSKGVIRLPLLHYDVPFAGYGEMLLRMNRIYDLLGMPDAGSCMRSLRKAESRFPFGAGAFVSARRLSAGAGKTGFLKTGEDVE